MIIGEVTTKYNVANAPYYIHLADDTCTFVMTMN